MNEEAKMPTKRAVNDAVITPRDFTLDFEPEKDYRAGLDEAKSPNELIAHVARYRVIADDAYHAVNQMSDDDWSEWRRGLELERAGKFAGEEWAARFAVVTMPEVMFMASVTAAEFGVPWSVAFRRMVEVGEFARSTNNNYHRRKKGAGPRTDGNRPEQPTERSVEKTVAPESRTTLRREAAQRGEEPPEFDGADTVRPDEADGIEAVRRYRRERADQHSDKGSR